MSKRLEKGTFCWPATGDAQQVKLKLAPEAFAMLKNTGLVNAAFRGLRGQG